MSSRYMTQTCSGKRGLEMRVGVDVIMAPFWDVSLGSGGSSRHGPAHTQQKHAAVCFAEYVPVRGKNGGNAKWVWVVGIHPQGYSMAAPLHCTARLLLPSN